MGRYITKDKNKSKDPAQLPTNQDVKKEDLIVTRIIDAPVEQVWRAWTDPEYVKRWWGPKDYTSPSCKIDLRVGGKYLFSMRAPEDQVAGISTPPASTR